MRNTLVKTLVAASISLASLPAMAGGIAVVDFTAIGKSIANEAARWGADRDDDSESSEHVRECDPEHPFPSRYCLCSAGKHLALSVWGLYAGTKLDVACAKPGFSFWPDVSELSLLLVFDGAGRADHERALSAMVGPGKPERENGAHGGGNTGEQHGQR